MLCTGYSEITGCQLSSELFAIHQCLNNDWSSCESSQLCGMRLCVIWAELSCIFILIFTLNGHLITTPLFNMTLTTLLLLTLSLLWGEILFFITNHYWVIIILSELYLVLYSVYVQFGLMSVTRLSKLLFQTTVKYTASMSCYCSPQNSIATSI